MADFGRQEQKQSAVKSMERTVLRESLQGDRQEKASDRQPRQPSEERKDPPLRSRSDFGSPVLTREMHMEQTSDT